MAEWGAGPFENDDAADWVYELEESPRLSTLQRALDVATMRYVEVREGSVAVAAAEVVAATLGTGRPLPQRATDWLRDNAPEVSDQEVALAISAVDRVLGDGSELRALWARSPDAGWEDATRELRHRLGP